jgi:rubrerythrin
MRPLHELLIEAANRQQLSPATRRGVLTLAGAAATVPAAMGIETVMAQVTAERGNRGQRRRKRARRRGEREEKQNQGNRRNDIRILNYALTLEHLEYAFYRDGLAQFDANDFDPGVFDLLTDIRDHEDTHVDVLTDVINDLGGDPVEEAPCYDFGNDFDEPNGFLEIAQLLENTGVSAYTGALADIKSGDVQTAGATIATVEARHASYLNLINGDNPFPAAFDTPLTMQEVLDAAAAFFDCVP